MLCLQAWGKGKNAATCIRWNFSFFQRQNMVAEKSEKVQTDTLREPWRYCHKYASSVVCGCRCTDEMIMPRKALHFCTASGIPRSACQDYLRHPQRMSCKPRSIFMNAVNPWTHSARPKSSRHWVPGMGWKRAASRRASPPTQARPGWRVVCQSGPGVSIKTMRRRNCNTASNWFHGAGRWLFGLRCAAGPSLENLLQGSRRSFWPCAGMWLPTCATLLPLRPC